MDVIRKETGLVVIVDAVELRIIAHALDAHAFMLDTGKEGARAAIMLKAILEASVLD